MIEIRAVQTYKNVRPSRLARLFGAKERREYATWYLQYREVIDENTATNWKTVESIDEEDLT